jgi:Xaa-Pro dipeptidase
MKAWEAVTGALKIVEQMARPGVRCQEIFAAVDEHFKQTRKTNMPHHLGHGVGLQPHEYPHLNPKWDDVLMEGEVFTAEPGQYGAELKEGIRLENDYLVTKNGVEGLLDFPLEMA